MPDRESVNLPDLLGAITGGERLNLDVVQCALGVRPSSIPAGRPFEAILLLQNASDVDVDVTAQVRLPDKNDGRRKRNRFILKRDRLVVGLRPAEVGFLTIPISSSPKTAPDSDYQIVIDLAVKRMGDRRPNRVRDSEGGALFIETELDEQIQDHIWQLQQMLFSAERTGRSALGVRFTIQPPTLGEVADFTPGWTSLWTMRDHVDEHILAERVKEQLDLVLPRLNRDNLFYPLLDAVQARFRERGGYYLKAGEAVYITKLLVLVLEQGVPEIEEGVTDHFPDWFTRLCRVLFDHPEAVRNVPHIFSDLIFNDLLHDGLRLSVEMINTINGDPAESEEELQAFIDSYMARLDRGEMDFQHVYWPLVLGGLIANTRIVMPREVPRETIWLLQRACEERQPSIDEYDHQVLDITNTLVERALDQTG